MANNNPSNKGNKISRRTFVTRSFTGIALMSLAPMADLWAQQAKVVASWASGAAATTFHMIGHGHVDAVWLWPWTEGVSVVMSTFQAALDRMNENPDFKFTASSAQFYQWVADNDPQMLEQIKRRIKEGRWEVVGGWWVEPDANMPCGEALVRQGLYGQLTLERLVGRRATTGFNPDSFGHIWTIPQILKLQGMDHYVFTRPMPHQKSLDSELFWWQGPDGSRVLAYRIQIGYSNKSDVRERVQRTLKEYTNQPMSTYMGFYGAGDHGGGATKANFRSIAQIQGEADAPKLLYSTPGRYFRQMLANTTLQIPTVNDDLQHEAVGCYTVECKIKKGNRMAETVLITAEKIAAIGAHVWGAAYPQEALTAAWKRLLFLQFHDSLAGSSLVEHSKTAQEGFGYVMDVADGVITMAMQKLEWQIPSEDPNSEYVVLFNPHAWAVEGCLEYNFNIKEQAYPVDEHGEVISHQWTVATSQTESMRRLVFLARVPAMGYRQIRVVRGKAPEVNGELVVTGNTMENSLVRVTISESGAVGIFDKQRGEEIFVGGSTGSRAVVLDDKSDTWSHGVVSFKDETGAFGGAKLKVLERGPMRATIRSTTTYGNSTLTIDWSLGQGTKELEAKVELDWHERQKMLRFAYPVQVEQPTATYELPYGAMAQKRDGSENPGQRWINMTGQCGGETVGLTVINDAKYGYSTLDNELRVSVARSPVYAHNQPNILDTEQEYVWMDQGIQQFRLLLIPHTQGWQQSGVVQRVEEFSAPTLIIYQGIHGGRLSKSTSSLELDSPRVLVTSIKQAERGEELIVRCVEACGAAGEASVQLHLIGKTWTGEFTPFEIKTLRVNLKKGTISIVNLLEE